MNTLRLQLVALSLFAAPGCAMNGDKVAVESELRNKEATIRHLEKRVTESERMLADQDREIETLRSTTVGHTKAAKPGKDSPITFSNVSSTTETSTAWGSVTSVRIHTLTSGIVKDPDGEPNGLLLETAAMPVQMLAMNFGVGDFFKMIRFI